MSKYPTKIADKTLFEYCKNIDFGVKLLEVRHASMISVLSKMIPEFKSAYNHAVHESFQDIIKSDNSDVQFVDFLNSIESRLQ